MLRNTELRKLPTGKLYEIATILETNDDWKKVMSFVPRNPRSDFFEHKYTNAHIKQIEDHAKASGKKCADILFEEWGTSGRIRPTLGTLKDVVEKAGILRAADLLADMLEERRPDRPKDGPGADVDTGVTKLMMEESTGHIVSGSTKQISDPQKATNSFSNRTTQEVRSNENQGISTPDFSALMKSHTNPTESYQKSLPVISVSFPGIERVILENRNLIDFPYATLESITMKFSEKLIYIPSDQGQGKLAGKVGSGGFGDVYAGFHPNHGQLAVKRAQSHEKFDENPEIAIKVFNSEVKFLAQLRHKNIVPLIGFSKDGPLLCIVFEYIHGGSLDQKIAAKILLTEKERLHIMIGTAEGLKYLHGSEAMPGEEQTNIPGSESQSSGRNFIHRDVKSANILLTRDCTPKLCDFGLVKQYDKTFVTTSPMGTRAYMAPEGFTGTITQKIDIYSYGIVMLELLTGLKPLVKNNQAKETLNIKDYVEETCPNDITNLLTPYIDKWTKAKEIYQLARSCVVYDRKKRPTASTICETLNKILDEKEKEDSDREATNSSCKPSFPYQMQDSNKLK